MEIKISVVVTVKNDEAGIARLKEVLGRQTVRPEEVIVIRAEEHGNCSRGKGRNIGIRMAKNEVIAVTDAGCRPHPDWLDKLYKCYKSYKNQKLVIAGWYRAEARTELQRVMAHFLVPVDFFDLPASRSIMFTKRAWQAVGGYPEEAVSGAEDLEFARRLAAHPRVKMIYCPEAVVDWDGPATLGEFFRDIVKHTRGNVEVGYRPHLIKNFTVILRWLVFVIFPWMIPIYLGVSWLYKGPAFGYKSRAFIMWFPVVQLVADAGVIWGNIIGVPMGYKRLMLGGVGKMGGLRIFTRAAALGKMAILARILTPYDFGLFGMAALALAFFENLTETGVNQALIHSDRKTEELVDSAWVVSIVRGVLISVLILAAAWPLAIFFRNREVAPLVFLVAAAPLVKGFINPMVVNFLKELEFGRELKFRSILVLVDAAAAIGAAIIFKSAAALVLALLVAGLTEVLMSFIWFKVRPKFKLRPGYLGEILGYGKWVTVSGVLSWAAGEIDDLVAGRWFGTGALGVYQQAYKISTLPVTEISGTVNQVAFPVLSKVKADRNRFWRIFWGSVGGIGVIGVIGGAILWFFPREVVMILLGKAWLEAVPLVRYLAIFGVIRSLESGIQPAFLAAGRPWVGSFGNAIKVAALISGLIIWGRMGLTGVATAAVVSAAAAMPYYLINLIGLVRLTRKNDENG